MTLRPGARPPGHPPLLSVNSYFLSVSIGYRLHPNPRVGRSTSRRGRATAERPGVGGLISLSIHSCGVIRHGHLHSGPVTLTATVTGNGKVLRRPPDSRVHGRRHDARGRPGSARGHGDVPDLGICRAPTPSPRRTRGSEFPREHRAGRTIYGRCPVTARILGVQQLRVREADHAGRGLGRPDDPASGRTANA